MTTAKSETNQLSAQQERKAKNRQLVDNTHATISRIRSVLDEYLNVKLMAYTGL